MNLPYLTQQRLAGFIRTALEEDLGEGDHSSLSCIPPDVESKAQLLIKDDGIMAGLSLAEMIFQHVDPALQTEMVMKDGQSANVGDIGLFVSGKAQSILSAERLVLNCMQRMSGIATYTHHLTQLIAGTGAKLLDTRKTTPNFRMLEKWAVAIGGGDKPPLRVVRHGYPEG